MPYSCENHILVLDLVCTGSSGHGDGTLQASWYKHPTWELPSFCCIAQMLSPASKTVSLYVSCSHLSSGQAEQPVPSSQGKCQCHLHMSQTSSPQAVVLLTPAWRCFVSAQAGCSGLQLNLSHSYRCLWFYHWLLQQDGNPQAHTVMFWCLKIVGSFLFGIFTGLFLLSNVVNVGNLISCLNDFHGCAQHPVMVLPLYEHLPCHC